MTETINDVTLLGKLSIIHWLTFSSLYPLQMIELCKRILYIQFSALDTYNDWHNTGP